MIHLLFILIIFGLGIWQGYNLRQALFKGGDVDKIFLYHRHGRISTYFPIHLLIIIMILNYLVSLFSF